MEQKRLHILDAMPVPQAILKLAVPTMLGMLVQVFYNMTDTFFVGRLNDANQVAAVAITMPIFMITMALSGIFGRRICRASWGAKSRHARNKPWRPPGCRASSSALW